MRPVAYFRPAAAWRGFTLVEMLISLSIFGIVTAFAVANFKYGAQSDELRMAARTVSSTIRRAQTYAMTGFTVKYCVIPNENGTYSFAGLCGSNTDCSAYGGGICTSGVALGYGVRIMATQDYNSSVALFVDTNGNKTLDSGEMMPVTRLTPNAKVFVAGFEPSESGHLDIVFVPPKPTVWFNGFQTVGVATVTVEHRATGSRKNITVNRVSGQINAD